MSTKSVDSVLQLRIDLKEVRPPIWRRILVLDSIDLNRLHEIIQDAMGWTNTHLYEFEIAGEHYSMPDEDDPEDSFVDAGVVTLRSLDLSEKDSFEYLYDFGDGWYHKVVVEAVNEPEPGEAYPRCLAGKRACPPEDCGGPHLYPEVLKAVADPNHPEHEEFSEWLNPDFDPESFDVEETDEVLVSNFGSRRQRN